MTADPMRRPVDRAGWIAAHRDGDRDGHGLDSCAASEGRAYYGFDRGAVRFLVLDTVNEQGGWQGSLDEEQFGWLERELAEGSRRHLDREGRTVEHDTTDRLFVLVSHHPLETLVNDYSPNGTRRVLADEVADLLGRFPNVVAWVNGHTHANTVRPVHTAGALGGFWQLTVASHIDWPQQSRVVELALDESTGSIVIVSSMLDHAGILDGRLGALEDPLTLAGWSRELAANAWQGRVGGTPVGRGERLDRNVVCTIPAPFPLEAT